MGGYVEKGLYTYYMAWFFFGADTHTHTHTRTHIPHNKGKQKGMTSSFTRHINMLSGKIKPFSSRTVRKHTLVNVPEGPRPEAQGSTCRDTNGTVCAL